MNGVSARIYTITPRSPSPQSVCRAAVPQSPLRGTVPARPYRSHTEMRERTSNYGGEAGHRAALAPRRSGGERRRCARRCRWLRLLPPSSSDSRLGRLIQESDETHRLLAGPVPLSASRIFCTSSWRLRSFLPAMPRAVAASHACEAGMPARSPHV